MLRAVRVLTAIMLAMVLAIAADAATVSRHYSRAKSKVSESASAQRRKAQLSHSRSLAKAPVAKKGGKSARTARSARSSKAARAPRAEAAVADSRTLRGARLKRVSRRMPARVYGGERFTASSFASESSQTAGDITAGEDPVVRKAAIEALGNMNGTVVAIDPSDGRVLAMVNQKLALSSGAQPCSTIKVAVALAALDEGVVTKDTPVALGKQWSMDMTTALAHSNNAYFEELGRRMGFQKVRAHAHEYGLGELAGYNIPGEHLGVYPDTELPAKLGGVGKMCSFGESISMTPLQLGALMASVANGGTLYYLQHPRTPEEVAAFRPKVKRYLNIRPLIPEINQGMAGAVQYGTARRLRESFTEAQVLGKTGTCSKAGTRYGWFASYANTQHGRIVTVVFLEGGRPTFGPKAAELTGKFYRELYDHDYFAGRGAAPSSVRSVVQSR